MSCNRKWPFFKNYLSANANFAEFEDIFVVNDFVLAKEFTRIKPTYYLFADPGYWLDNVPDEMKLLRQNVFNQLNSLTKWDLTIMLPRQCYLSNVFQQNISNQNIRLVYFNTTKIAGPTAFRNYCYKNNFGMPPLQNVLNAAIYLATFYNYKQISLVGAEHSWTKNLFVNGENEVCQLNSHFYDEEVSDKVWLKWNGQPYKMFEILKDLSLVFYSYELLHKFAKSKGCEIFNLNKESFIDSFTKIKNNGN